METTLRLFTFVGEEPSVFGINELNLKSDYSFYLTCFKRAAADGGCFELTLSNYSDVSFIQMISRRREESTYRCLKLNCDYY